MGRPAPSWPGRLWDNTIRHKDCLLWLGALDSAGYGIIRWHGKLAKTHRLAWLFTYGYWSRDLILHHCDTRRCINPDHLYEGTAKDNALDRDSRGRWKDHWNQ